MTFDALGDAIRLTAEEFVGGTTLPKPIVTYVSSAPFVATVDVGGLVMSRGNGTAWIAARAPSGATDSILVTVAQQAARVVASRDTLLFEALEAVQTLDAGAVDRMGTEVAGVALSYAATDAAVATVGPAGDVRALANGLTTVMVVGGGESLTVVVRVQQRPVRVLTDADSLRFIALGETATVIGVPVDSLGHTVPGGIADLAVEDTTVLELVDSVTIRAKQNGRTMLRFSAAGFPVQQLGVVSQIPDTIVVSLADPQQIVSLEQDSLIALSCQVLDQNGYAVAVEPTVSPSNGGRWSGSTCRDLRIQRSGFDTLVLSAGSRTTVLSVTLAVRPEVSSALGQYLEVDSLPTDVLPWAPTLWRGPSGNLELYFAGYVPDNSSLTGFRGHLHRLVSTDGVRYRYDGVVLQIDPSNCALNGSGIENIAIVPRADASGWRMYYSSGSFDCYGWQVFSAVSSDGNAWSKEPGIRLDNGSPVPPAPPGTPQLPVGEGMVVEQLPTGEWRMLVGGYRRDQPMDDKFHIVEWRSPDQLSWTYVGPVLTTDQLPPTGQRSVYSPTIREFAPGLWRMIVTADNLGVPGGRSRLWSAVSTDRASWQIEGEIMGAVGTDLFYSTLVDDRLVLIRKEAEQYQRLASATVVMP
jgi:hypothetical protein